MLLYVGLEGVALVGHYFPVRPKSHLMNISSSPTTRIFLTFSSITSVLPVQLANFTLSVLLFYFYCLRKFGFNFYWLFSWTFFFRLQVLNGNSFEVIFVRKNWNSFLKKWCVCCFKTRRKIKTQYSVWGFPWI